MMKHLYIVESLFNHTWQCDARFCIDLVHAVRTWFFFFGYALLIEFEESPILHIFVCKIVDLLGQRIGIGSNLFVLWMNSKRIKLLCLPIFLEAEAHPQGFQFSHGAPEFVDNNLSARTLQSL